jgi:hypothetical protein
MPNGYVYGQNWCHTTAAKHGGKVQCPRTKQIFAASNLEKVYVM